MNTAGKTLLITGATGGIGSACAEALAAAGARLILCGRRPDALQVLAERLPGQHTLFAGNLADATKRADLVTRLRGELLDGAVLCAGVLEFGLFRQQPEISIEHQIEVNLLSPMLLARALVPLLESRPESSLVFIGSIFGHIGHPGFAAYCATKSGLQRFAEALRRELADTSVSVGYLAPRATRTALNTDSVNELNRALGNAVDDPQRVAAALLSLIESGSAEQRVGWPERLFVVLNALLPRLVERALVAKLPTIKHHAHIPDFIGETP